MNANTTTTTLVQETGEIDVAFVDGRKDKAILRPLTIREIYKFIEHLTGNNSPALVAMCAKKDEEWVDRLTLESYNKLIASCVKLNFQKAVMLMENDPAIAAKMAPFMVNMISGVAGIKDSLKDISRLIAGEPTSASSPAPASLGSAAAIGSVS